MFQSVLIIFRVLLNISRAYYTICSSAELNSSTLLQIVFDISVTVHHIYK